MNWLKRNQMVIIVGALLIVGACTVIFGKTLKVQGGVTCLCWGIAVLVLAYNTYNKNQWHLDEFDKESKEILKDVAINGEESEYYGLVDINIMNKQRTKLAKNLRKQVVSCVIFGTILLISCILCMI